MKPRFTIEQLQKLQKEGKIRGFKVGDINVADLSETPAVKGKQSKYRNKKTEINGIVFDSEKEANRYRQLLWMLKAGVIGLLQLQVPYELNEGGTHSLLYIADFVYVERKTGKTIVEDVKGWRTQEYKKKRRLMKKVHGIVIKEI
jgi:hypothetical protein